VPPERQPTPSPIRELLRRHALEWARLSSPGAAPREPGGPLDVLLVDPFAGNDYPAAAPLGLDVAALLGRRGAAGSGRVLLQDADPVKLEWLRARAAEAEGAGQGLVEVGEEEGTAGSTAAGRAAEALVVLDPPAAGHVPLEALTAWADTPGTELLLRFPAADLRRLARQWVGTLADLTPYGKRLVEGLSSLLGDPRREWVLSWRGRLEVGGAAAAERAVVERLAERLRERAAIRLTELKAPGADEPEYLLALSRDPARLLRLNETMYAARRVGLLAWPEEPDTVVRYVESGELALFDGPGAGAASPRDRVVDTAALAHSLARRFAGGTVSLDRVLHSLLDTDLFLADVRRALAELRRDGRVLYRSLAAGSAELAFPRPGARLRGRAPARRRPRAAGDDLSLALEEGGARPD
jgi:hypothetical protein